MSSGSGHKCASFPDSPKNKDCSDEDERKLQRQSVLPESGRQLDVLDAIHEFFVGKSPEYAVECHKEQFHRLVELKKTDGGLQCTYWKSDESDANCSQEQLIAFLEPRLERWVHRKHVTKRRDTIFKAMVEKKPEMKAHEMLVKESIFPYTVKADFKSGWNSVWKGKDPQGQALPQSSKCKLSAEEEADRYIMSLTNGGASAGASKAHASTSREGADALATPPQHMEAILPSRDADIKTLPELFKTQMQLGAQPEGKPWKAPKQGMVKKQIKLTKRPTIAVSLKLNQGLSKLRKKFCKPRVEGKLREEGKLWDAMMAKPNDELTDKTRSQQEITKPRDGQAEEIAKPRDQLGDEEKAKPNDDRCSSDLLTEIKRNMTELNRSLLTFAEERSSGWAGKHATRAVRVMESQGNVVSNYRALPVCDEQ